MTSAADRAMPGPDAPPRSRSARSPAMRTILGADWFQRDFGETRARGRVANHEAVFVDALPKCDFCAACATFDGRLRGRSSWANMCSVHFAEFGVGLGLGVGQELLVRPA